MIHLDIEVFRHDVVASRQGPILRFLFWLFGNRRPVAVALEKKVARRLRRRLREHLRRLGIEPAVRLRVQVVVPPPAPPAPAAPATRRVERPRSASA